MAIQILQGAGVGILQSLLAMLFLIPGIAKLFNYKVGTKKRMLEGCAQIVIAFFATTLISITLAVCGAWCGVIVPLVGLAYEKLRANNKCDCFGAISEVMEPWKNIYRAVLVATSAMLLAIYALSDISFMNQQSYIVGIFVSLLSGISALIILFSRQINSKLGLRGIIKAPVRNKFEPIQLEISTSLGENRLNETISISEFCVPNVPILIVFTSSTCTFCKPDRKSVV